MPAAEPEVAPHLEQFLAMLDRAFVRLGRPGGLPRALRDAVRAVPRHRFVHRFRITDGPLLDADADGHLDLIYSDAVMRHVDADGAALPSSNSQPSFILSLLDMLDLQPGARVLEIGSGSGWLAAVMARLVGPDGRVTGIEIIPDLARQSRADLAALGSGNVTIMARDGTLGDPAGAPFDRVMLTAGTWDLPMALFDQVADSGAVLVPIELRGTGSCQVTLLRRTGLPFVAERSRVGWFVPLIGAGQMRAETRHDLPPPDAPPTVRVRLPLGAGTGGPSGTMAAFRAFLGRTEAAFTGFGGEATKPADAFGLYDPAGEAAAMCRDGWLLGYGDPALARRLARAYANWAAFGLPGLAAFHLEVWPAEAAPATDDRSWVERRNRTALLWRLPADLTDWRSLLPEAAEAARGAAGQVVPPGPP